MENTKLSTDKNISVLAKVCDVGTSVFFVIMFICFTILSAISLISTSKFDPTDLGAEKVIYLPDDIAMNFFSALLLLVAMVLLAHYTKFIHKINITIATIALLVYTTVLSFVWIYSVTSVSTTDSGIMIDAAKQLSQGNFQSFYSSYDYYNQQSYFKYYPFQLGYVFICECVFFLFGRDNWIVLQALNVIALNFIVWAFVKLSYMIFQNKTVSLITIILMAGCFQGIFFTTFTYGNFMGLAAGLWACVFVLDYMKKGKKINILFAALLMAFSVLAKYNNLIFLAAIAIILLLHTLKHKRIYSLISIGILCLITLGSNNLLIYSYEVRSGIDLSGGVSQVLYAYMGMTDSNLAPGWYNGKAMETYRDHDLQIGPAEEETKREIRLRIDYFKQNPDYAREFYYKKLASQWNEPTYESIWISQVKPHYEPIGKVGNWVYHGEGKDFFDEYFNLYHLLIFIGFSAGMFFCIRKKSLSVALIPIVIFGGLAYHMIFEAKSQYIITYFMTMIPFAAYGLYRLSTLPVYKKLLPGTKYE